MSTPVGKMKIYGCGGAGINIANYFNDAKQEPLSAEISVAYFDTSRSNFLKKDNIRKEDTYVLNVGGESDGSGKVRSQNYDRILDEVKQALLQHKPTDFNVVVFSAGGGSGSVFGPIIIKEFLEKNIPVFAIVIGADESKQAATNTLNTLKSLEGISRNIKKPVIMHYRHNKRGKARSEVDAELQEAISFLAILCSRQIPEIDTQDIRNFMDYTTTTSVKARLASLEILTNEEKIYEGCRPHTIMSIYESPDEATLELIPEYHCGGYVELPTENLHAIHYLIDVESIPRFVLIIQKTLDELKEISDSRIEHKSIISDQEADDNGMCI